MDSELYLLLISSMQVSALCVQILSLVTEYLWFHSCDSMVTH